MFKLRYYPDPVLRRKAYEVRNFDSSNLEFILENMRRVFIEHDAIGLAAPQVGLLKRIFLLKLDDKLEEFINPVIIETSGKNLNEEGCLSFPGLYFKIERARKVTISAYKADGKRVERKFEGVMARVVQHEIDHLNGVLYIDYLTPEERLKVDLLFIGALEEV